jgi:hypothetical protein
MRRCLVIAVLMLYAACATAAPKPKAPPELLNHAMMVNMLSGFQLTVSAAALLQTSLQPAERKLLFSFLTGLENQYISTLPCFDGTKACKPTVLALRLFHTTKILYAFSILQIRIAERLKKAGKVPLDAHKTFVTAQKHLQQFLLQLFHTKLRPFLKGLKRANLSLPAGQVI